MTDLAPLPRSLVPLPGESLPGFLLRLAHRLDLSPSELAWQTKLNNARTPSPTAVPARLLFMLESGTLDAFAASTRMTAEQANQLTLRPFVAAYPPLAEALSGQGNNTLRPRGVFPPWLTISTPRYCPRCLAGDGSTIQQRHGGPWKVLWHLPIVFSCPEHRVFLEHACSACQMRPGTGFHKGPTKLLAATGTVGLHPAQCRNTADGKRESPLCLNRLDATRDISTTTLTRDMEELQAQLLALLAGGPDPAASRQRISDLRVMTAFITATWPLAADHAPSPELAHHFSKHSDLLNDDKAGPRWDALPMPAPSTGALLATASNMLALPRAELRQELIRTAQALPMKTKSSWGKTWRVLADDCSPVFQQDAQHALEWRYSTAGPVRRPELVFTPDPNSYLPEYVPQWLPDEWLDVLVESSGPTPLPRSPLFRRAAAVHLVQAVTDMPLDRAAAYLKIPKKWLEGRAKIQPIADKLRHPDYGIEGAFKRLAEHIGKLPNPADYFARRQQFDLWTLRTLEWHQILAEAEVGPRLQTSSVLRQVSAAYVWSQITGTEWILAPCMRPPLAPASHRTDTDSPAGKKLQELKISKEATYTALRAALSRHAEQLVR